MKHVLSMAFALAFAVPGHALACSCIPPQPVPEAVGVASRVFVGEVVSTRDTGDLYRRVVFRATEHFKGSPVDTIELTTAQHGAMCGYPFRPGVRYVVYTHGDDDALRTGTCSRTTPATGGSDLDALRALD